MLCYKLPLHCVSSYPRGNNDAYDTNKMAEDFTHQFLDQAFSVGQQVQLQHWQLFSEIRVLDFFLILIPCHIQRQLKWHSRKFWTSLPVSKLGDLGESTVIHLGFRVSCWFKLKIFYVYFPINNSLSSGMSWQRIYIVCDLFPVACKGLCYSEI